MFNGIFLNLILLFFPILVYFVYYCYCEVCMEKYNQTLLSVALFSSLYLCLKFGNVFQNDFTIIFCNLPIIVAYLKKQSIVGIIMSIVVIYYIYCRSNFSIIIICLNLGCYYLLYLLAKYRHVKNNTFILSIVVVQGFFFSIGYFGIIHNFHFFHLVEILFVMMLFYILPFSLLYLFQMGDKVTRLYSTVSELERDKQIKNSLFKITHEVKNPIAVCRGYLDMLDVNNQDQVKKYIPIVRSEIARSLDIMNNFMEFSKIKIDKELIDINLLLEEIVEEIDVLMCCKKISFSTHILNDEIYVYGDYNRLKQVFVNLVKNSIESIQKDGKIEIVTHILKGKYYIEVIDNGCGMDEDALSKVKEMFFTTKDKGSGLGVSLSNEIIVAHQGSMDYYSKVNCGTKVVVKLPIVML